MKKIFSHPSILFSFLLCGISLSILAMGTFSFALESNDPAIEDEGDPAILSAHRENVDKPSCLDNYLNWPTSDEYNPDNKWSTDFISFEGALEPFKKRENFLDVNRDGLADYIYARKWHSGNLLYTESCLLLNNGAGWDLAYQCIRTRDGIYYGDCALVE